MIIKEHAFDDIATPTGPMRTHLFAPAAPGRYPGIVLYSEIYQITGPVRRMAAFLAGQGFVVAAPEVYHEYEKPGTVLLYDAPGTDRGNALKFEKTVAAYDGDARAALDHLKAHPACEGTLGAMGICLGGHLAFRAAMNPDVAATACFYATDIHDHQLGKGNADNSLARAGDIKGELMMIWGRQDPHAPLEGRRLIRDRLEEVGADYTWHEFNAAHAFMRDEGPRYDPALAWHCYGLVTELFKRRLG
ncbi:MAG TPA: dienelactone hydrolase family protein [Stellaceae bacterium]|nr:dienelactone hydrolase family protein [Stellaceae bacterium]